jgi:hypothetical protein
MSIILRRQTGGWRSVGAVDHRRMAQKGITIFQMNDNWLAARNGSTHSHGRDILTAQEPYSRNRAPVPAIGGTLI